MSALFNATVDDQVLAVSISSHRAVRAATILDRYEQAEAWFAIAHNLHARLQAPYWTACGQLDHADLCLTRRADSDLQRARDLATTAAATAAEYGCEGLSRRAANLLASGQVATHNARSESRTSRTSRVDQRRSQVNLAIVHTRALIARYGARSWLDN
jgi:hypothetical protein